jgi:acyl-CoA synthetase (AMP-forming)/AMP-acid ligase II
MNTWFRIGRNLTFLLAGYYTAKGRIEIYIPLIIIGGLLDLLVKDPIKIK